MKVSKTIELRKVIHKELLKLCDRVYYQEADSDIEYPYVVYELDNSIKNSSRDDVALVIDVWDRNIQNDSSVVEILSDNIEKLLDTSNLPNENIYPTFYKNLRNSIRDEDRLIKRRQLRFTIQNYEGGN